MGGRYHLRPDRAGISLHGGDHRLGEPCAWRLSNTMDVGFCLAALEEAFARFGKPEIFNTDQGSQFTSGDFTGMLAAAGIRISMDGRGRWIDNVFIERLWRSLKYEDIYLKGYADGREARAGIGEWLAFYNHRRPHQALANRTPMTVWCNGAGALGGEAVDMLQRCRVAHIPTAAATASSCSLTIQEVGAAALPINSPAPVVPLTGSTSPVTHP
jgi:putative transposase